MKDRPIAPQVAAIRATCDAAVMLSRIHMVHPDRFDRCRYPRCSCHVQVAAIAKTKGETPCT
jgi:hypothetical protein